VLARQPLLTCKLPRSPPSAGRPTLVPIGLNNKTDYSRAELGRFTYFEGSAEGSYDDDEGGRTCHVATLGAIICGRLRPSTTLRYRHYRRVTVGARVSHPDCFFRPPGWKMGASPCLVRPHQPKFGSPRGGKSLRDTGTPRHSSLEGVRARVRQDAKPGPRIFTQIVMSPGRRPQPPSPLPRHLHTPEALLRHHGDPVLPRAVLVRGGSRTTQVVARRLRFFVKIEGRRPTRPRTHGVVMPIRSSVPGYQPVHRRHALDQITAVAAR